MKGETNNQEKAEIIQHLKFLVIDPQQMLNKNFMSLAVIIWVIFIEH